MTERCTTIHDRESALAFLLRRIDYERTPQVPYRSRSFKLDRMRQLMSRIGNPEKAIRLCISPVPKAKVQPPS